MRHFVRTARMNSRQRGFAEQVQEEHRMMLEAIATGDPGTARAAAEQHLANAFKRLGLAEERADGEQVCTSTARHGSLEHLQSIDLPLSLAVAPSLQDGVADGLNVLLYRAGEAPHPMDVRLARIAQPKVQLLCGFTPKKAAQAHGKLTHDEDARSFCRAFVD